MTVAENSEPIGKSGKMSVGEMTFHNPLVIENDSLNWKKTLSDQYGGKTGKELSKALIANGHDGVITTDKNHISEVLDLTTFNEAKALYQSAKGKITFRKRPKADIGYLRECRCVDGYSRIRP
jgi:hypothetical protein